MLAAAQQAGIDWIVATPHVRRADFDRALAVQRYQELSVYAQEKEIRLDLGFEVHWNFLVTLEPELYAEYCIQGTRRILIEFSLSADDLPDGHDRKIYQLQRSGLIVVIAHPERYPFVQKDRTIAERWRDMGCELQLDANCLVHAYERSSKPTARKLFKDGLFDHLCSDAHCTDDYSTFSEAMSWAKKHS